MYIRRTTIKSRRTGEPYYTYRLVESMRTPDGVRPRSVGVEHVALATIRQLGLDRKLEELGFNGPQMAAALGNLIGRIAAPASERATDDWLKHQSGLGELIGYVFEAMNPWQLYRISDQLLKHKAALETFLYAREQSLFDFEEVITLYDLTNTYFEGTAATNDDAQFGHSKEKRTDCPLVTLALVLDASGFPKCSEIFPGNAKEAETLETMLSALHHDARSPTVVLDAGIATEENVVWLNAHGYRYVVVSRKRQRRFDPDQATLIKEADGVRIQAQRLVNADTGEVELYCHSTQRQKTEEGMQRRNGSSLGNRSCAMLVFWQTPRYHRKSPRSPDAVPSEVFAFLPISANAVSV